MQRRLTARTRAFRAKVVPAPGVGQILAGPAVKPFLAEVASSFDAHAHLAGLRDDIAALLTLADVPVYEMPDERPPLLVISDTDWDRAWRALAQDDRAAGLWVAPSGGRAAVALHGRKPGPTHPTSIVFRRVVAPGGEVLADRDLHVRVERWHRVPNAGVRRLDGGTYEVGTLLRGEAPPNRFASELSPRVLAGLHTGADRKRLPAVGAVTQPVDLVYTWVNGDDPVWAEKRARWSAGGFTVDAQVTSRFVDHDELRFSLRSVEMYANWFNRIFLVTDAQTPEWLNRAHPRLTVVDHRELFSAGELPLFNSHAIESRLHRIEGLSERFIYLNDDVFFGRPVWPEDFFTGAGQARFFPSKATIDPAPVRADDVSVTAAAKNNRALLERAMGVTITTKLKHTPHAHLVSVLIELEQRFPEVFAANVAARFRSQSDHAILSGLAQRYGEATGRAVVSSIRYNYADITRPDIEATLAKWLRGRDYAVFCLNDTGSVLDGRAAQAFDAFLNTYFPVPSSFEIDQRDDGVSESTERIESWR